MLRSKPQVNKTTDLPSGVSRFEEIDHRRVGAKPIVGYGVLVKINGKPNVMKFRCSKYVDETRARAAALCCRRYFERCENKHLPFLPEMLGEWQKWRMQEFDWL